MFWPEADERVNVPDAVLLTVPPLVVSVAAVAVFVTVKAFILAIPGNVELVVPSGVQLAGLDVSVSKL